MIILIQIQFMHGRSNQFENELSAIENKHKSLKNRVEPVKLSCLKFN